MCLFVSFSNLFYVNPHDDESISIGIQCSFRSEVQAYSLSSVHCRPWVMCLNSRYKLAFAFKSEISSPRYNFPIPCCIFSLAFVASNYFQVLVPTLFAFETYPVLWHGTTLPFVRQWRSHFLLSVKFLVLHHVRFKLKKCNCPLASLLNTWLFGWDLFVSVRAEYQTPKDYRDILWLPIRLGLARYGHYSVLLVVVIYAAAIMARRNYQFCLHLYRWLSEVSINFDHASFTKL